MSKLILTKRTQNIKLIEDEISQLEQQADINVSPEKVIKRKGRPPRDPFNQILRNGKRYKRKT